MTDKRPKLLDLFSGAGGAARGYQLAGFHVTGVDIRPQPRYAGDTFFQDDALDYIASHGHEYEAVHASPPCQAFTQMSARYRGKGGKADSHPDLLTPTRALLRTFPQPWVIENVPGARRLMRPMIVLHGGMFGLGVHRPRLFESNVLLLAQRTACVRHPVGVYGAKPDGHMTYRYRNNGMSRDPDGTPRYAGKNVIRTARSLSEAQEAMGIDWMTWDEIKEAIPPAYTEFIGQQLIRFLGSG